MIRVHGKLPLLTLQHRFVLSLRTSPNLLRVTLLGLTLYFTLGFTEGLAAAQAATNTQTENAAPFVPSAASAPAGSLSASIEAANPSKSWSETSESEVHAIGSLLRCPVCQGMPIADSGSSTALGMMNRIRELHNEGKTKEEILQYFVSSYGEWVLLQPKKTGINWLLWLAPPIFLLLAILFVFRSSRHVGSSNSHNNSRRTLLKQNIANQNTSTNTAAVTASAAIQTSDNTPDYIQRIRDEVAK